MSSRLPWFIIAVLCVTCSACHKLETGHIVIQPDIVKNAVYKKLDKEKDIWEFGTDTPMSSKTSDISYRNDRGLKLNDTTYAKMYNCKSYINGNKLRIRVGRNSGFVASGFSIICEGQLFTIEPHYSQDAIPIYSSKPTFKVVEQALILNKPKYAVGDSIYGNVKFTILENDNGQKITHIGNGYFRSKINQGSN